MSPRLGLTHLGVFFVFYSGKIIDILIKMLILSEMEKFINVSSQHTANKETIWFKCGRGVQWWEDFETQHILDTHICPWACGLEATMSDRGY